MNIIRSVEKPVAWKTKSFKSTLSTQVKLSDEEADSIMTKIIDEQVDEKKDKEGPGLGTRFMDKVDFCLIPIVYLFRMTFSLLSLAFFLAIYFPTIVTKVLKNTTK